VLLLVSGADKNGLALLALLCILYKNVGINFTDAC